MLLRAFTSGRPCHGCRSLLTAAEDGAWLQEQAEALQDFLPPGGSAGELAAALAELEQVLRHPEAKHAFGWLHVGDSKKRQGPTQQGLHQAGGGAAGGAAGAAAAAGTDPPHAAVTVEQQEPLAPGQVLSTLSVGAAEFRPGPHAASLPAQLGSLQLSTDAEGRAPARGSAGAADADCSWPDGSASGLEDGFGWPEADATAGSWAGWDPERAPSSSPQQAHPAGRWAAAAAAAEAQAAAGGGLAAGAFLAVLADQFPLWSSEALQQLLEEQRGDLAATVSTLCSLESELEGQQQAGSIPEGSSMAGAAASSQASFTDDDFPSLGGSAPAGRSSGVVGSGMASSVPGGYASAAAAAADLPAERGQRGMFSRPPRRVVGAAAPVTSATAAAGQGPAPIWHQDEGVARFATGQALAAHYADLRADARDHARLRNAYFQQVCGGAGDPGSRLCIANNGGGCHTCPLTWR